MEPLLMMLFTEYSPMQNVHLNTFYVGDRAEGSAGSEFREWFIGYSNAAFVILCLNGWSGYVGECVGVGLGLAVFRSVRTEIAVESMDVY